MRSGRRDVVVLGDCDAQHHARVDVDEYVFRGEPEAMPYLMSIARISPVKGQDVAIEVARRFAAGHKAAVADVAKAIGLDEQTSLTMLERLTDAEIELCAVVANGNISRKTDAVLPGDYVAGTYTGRG